MIKYNNTNIKLPFNAISGNTSAALLTLIVGLLAGGHHTGGTNPGTDARARFAGPIAILRLIPIMNTTPASTQAFHPFGQPQRIRFRSELIASISRKVLISRPLLMIKFLLLRNV